MSGSGPLTGVVPIFSQSSLSPDMHDPISVPLLFLLISLLCLFIIGEVFVIGESCWFTLGGNCASLSAEPFFGVHFWSLFFIGDSILLAKVDDARNSLSTDSFLGGDFLFSFLILLERLIARSSCGCLLEVLLEEILLVGVGSAIVCSLSLSSASYTC